jgi:hypothetical protein
MALKTTTVGSSIIQLNLVLPEVRVWSQKGMPAQVPAFASGEHNGNFSS